MAEIRKELLFYKTDKTARNCGRSFLLSYGLLYGLFHVFYDQSTDFVAQTERCISDCATGTFIFGTFYDSHSKFSYFSDLTNTILNSLSFCTGPERPRGLTGHNRPYRKLHIHSPVQKTLSKLLELVHRTLALCSAFAF